MNACHSPTESAPSTERAPSIHRPQSSITENENGTRICIALPGVRKEDLKLTLLESNLKIEAPRRDALPETSQSCSPRNSIHHYGLELRLTSRLDGTQTSATFLDGVLTLEVPLREEAKPRPIQVN